MIPYESEPADPRRAVIECLRSLHRALVVEAVLRVLEDGGNRLQTEAAIRLLDGLLQVELLEREVMVAVFIRAAHRRKADLLHRLAHGVLLAEIAVDGD